MTIFALVRSLGEPIPGEDPEYLAGLRSAVREAVEYGFTGIERGDDWSAPLPPAAAGQARRAARYGVKLETVLRRCAAGTGA